MVINIAKEIVVTRYELGAKFIASAMLVISRGCTGIDFSHIFSFVLQTPDFVAFSMHLSFALNISRSWKCWKNVIINYPDILGYVLKGFTARGMGQAEFSSFTWFSIIFPVKFKTDWFYCRMNTSAQPFPLSRKLFSDVKCNLLI